MIKPFAAVRRLKFSYFPLLLLAVPVAVYFVFYVPSQEVEHTRRNLRVLKDLGDQIKSKIENHITVLHNAAGHAARNNYNAANFSDSVNAIIRSKLKLAPAVELLHSAALRSPQPISATAAIPAGGKDSSSPAGEHPGEDYSWIHQQTGHYRITHHILLEGKQNWIHYDYQGVFENNGGEVRIAIRARSNLDELFQPILSREIFDDVLVTRSSGEVIFQKGGKEISATDLETLSDPRGKSYKLTDLIHTSNTAAASFGGTHYKLFIQPLQLFLQNPPGENASNAPEYVEWSLCALVANERFRAETHAISYNFIIIFLLLALLTAISWPLLKIWKIGPQDRLRTSDVLFLALSVVVGAALLTVSVLDWRFYRNYKQELDRQLQDFSAEVSANFRAELERGIAQLDTLNAIFDLTYRGILRNKLSATDIWEAPRERGSVAAANASLRYPFFNLAVWIDSRGEQIVKWSTGDQTTSHINVRDRPYFKMVNGKKEGFWVESIYSWTTGKNEVILSKPFPARKWTAVAAPGKEPAARDSITVASMIIRQLSLLRPVVPAGFGFCVIDRSGKVLFHSDERRNLRENFIEECENNKGLVSALFGHTAKWETVKYAGKDQRVYIRPFSAAGAAGARELDWTLVTFCDMVFIRTGNLEIITITLMLFIAYAALFLLIIGAIRIFSPGYRAEWLWPEPALSGFYRQMAIAFLFLIALFFIWIFISRPLENLYTAVLLPYFVLVLSYLKLRDMKFEIASSKSHGRQPGAAGNLPEWQRILGYSVLGAILILLMVFSLLHASFWRTLVQCGGLAGMALFLSLPEVSRRFKQTQLFGYRNWFIVMATLLVIIVAILPSIAFFKIASDYEVELFIKHEQFDMAKKMLAGDARARAEIQSLKVDPALRAPIQQERQALADSLGRYFKFFFSSRIVTADSLPASGEASPLLVNLTLKQVLAFLRPPYNLTSAQIRGLIPDSSEDGSWKTAMVARREGDFLKLTYESAPRKRLAIATALPGAGFYWDILWWMGLAAIIAVQYLVFRFVAQRIVFLEFYRPGNPALRELRNLNFRRNLLVLAPPVSGKSELLEARKKERDDFHLIDLAETASPAGGALADLRLPEDRAVPLVLDHFETRFDPDLPNREILALLERLVHRERRTVVILSALDPLPYLDSEIAGPPSNAGEKTESITREDISRWARLLSHFDQVYLEDRGDASEFAATAAIFREKVWAGRENTRVKSERKARNRLVEAFEQECGANSRLQKIGREIVQQLDCSRLTADQLIHEVAVRAYSFYKILWDACNGPERLALIHLAEDGMVNSSNAPVVQQLLRKRLIVQKPFIRLMNESFRRFIASTYRPEDLAEEGTPGGWNSVKGPLLLALIVGVGFLFTTQRDLINTTITVLTTIAALIPAMAKFLGMFSLQKSGGGEK